MQKANLYLLFLLITASFVHCKNGKTRSTIQQPKLISPLFVQHIDSLEFRQSYVAGDKHPLHLFGGDSIVFEKLTHVGLIKNGSLVLSKFKNLDSFTIKNSTSNFLNARTAYDKDYVQYAIIISDKQDSTSIKLYENILSVKIILADIIPGGFDEIITLRNYYIMGGDNYQIDIYGITKNTSPLQN